MNESLIDYQIRDLVVALNDAGLETDWSCAGDPGHMVIRPTIQIRTSWPSFVDEQSLIERVMLNFGIADYWLLLNFAHGAYNVHGGDPTWILMIPGRFDLHTALPVAYDASLQTDEDLDPAYIQGRVFQRNHTNPHSLD